MHTLGQSGGEATGLPMQENHSDCTRVHLGHSGNVKPNSCVPAQPANTALQLDFSQESVKPKSARLAPIASSINEQGFSEGVAVQIGAAQRGST